ncbi:hypothetical protein PLESTM_001412200 [Pleodorina starrii]|nr:hypothetical protein PLESTM_001412200 [Pleodorina starrii]
MPQPGCPSGRLGILTVVLLVAASFFRAIYAAHFRAGIIEYALSNTRPGMLEVTVTTSWRSDLIGALMVKRFPWPDTEAIVDYTDFPGYLFDTNLTNVVGRGWDAAGNEFATTRSMDYLSVPTDAFEIFATDCCRIGNLVGYGDISNKDLQERFRFATRYIPGMRSSIATQAPAVLVIGKTSSPMGYAYTLVPAVSTHGAAIQCAINNDISYVEPGELETSAVAGGCRLGWRNNKYPLLSMVPVGLRISEPSTGHYTDITFLMMSMNGSRAPVLDLAVVTSTGQKLPPEGGVISVAIGTPVEVKFWASIPVAGVGLKASTPSLPDALTTTLASTATSAPSTTPSTTSTCFITSSAAFTSPTSSSAAYASVGSVAP